MEEQAQNQNIKKSNIKLVIISIVLGVLILVSGMQAMELASLKGTVTTELATLKATGQNSGASGSGNSADALKNNINNLPDMVGGC